MKLRKSVNTASVWSQKKRGRDKEEGKHPNLYTGMVGLLGQAPSSDPEGACSIDVLSPVLCPTNHITVSCERGSDAFQDKLAI